MSASSKKKLRKEQNAALLTERQRREQKEAKKLKAVSVVFIVIMICVVVSALTVMSIKAVQNSGVLERNTVAATVGEHKINSVEANYYFTDLISNTYSQWNSMYGDSTAAYLSLMGLDTSVPLDEQSYDEDSTWAEYFLESALDQAKSDYAMYDKAMAEGYSLSEEDQAALDSGIQNMEMYAMLYGYTDPDDYLKAMYGSGSDIKSYREYAQRSAVASSYYNEYLAGLTYDDAAIREYEKDVYNNYTSISYAYYYLSTNEFLPETETPTTEQSAQAEADAKAAAESLLACKDVVALDEAIADLEINAEAEDAHSTHADRTIYTGISSIYRDWLVAAERKENDVQMFVNETTAEDGTTTVNGYYVVMFQSIDENKAPMSNVRHLLVKHEHAEGEEHSDNDMAELKKEADGYLETWLAGDKTQDSFIELVKEHSDDSSASTGGLFEDINPDSAYVPSFLNWSIDPDRQPGDAEVIESEYGYHVMYYVGDDELTYRDFMILEDMKSEALEAWYHGIIDAAAITVGDTSRIHFDRVLAPA